MVITNQTAPARGLMTPEALAAIHRRLCADVATAGGRILDIFTCPHLPADGCSCRKPQPGLLYAAQRKYGIDFSSAAMIGDSAKDIECALNAGVRTTVLVQTGNGEKAAREFSARGFARTSSRWISTGRSIGSSKPIRWEGDASARSVLKNKHPDVRIRVQGAREQAVDELDAFLLEEFFFCLGAHPADVARLGCAVMDFQGLLGEVAADVVEIFLDKFGKLPAQMGEQLRLPRLGCLRLESLGGLDGKSRRHPVDGRVVCRRGRRSASFSSG